MKQVNTANGPIDVAMLGATLMHEHLTIAFPGSETDTLRRGPTFRDMVATCVDQVEELKAGGYTSLVDPCPNDMGRSIDLIGEVATRTGFNIVFATGLYNEAIGGNAYWQLKLASDKDGVRKLADVFITELTEGVPGTSGLKAGLLKVGTGKGAVSPYEMKVMEAAAIASIATGAPITTHTDYQLGPEQIRHLKSQDVPADRVVIGHCCGNPDHDYHMEIIGEGAYVGFDQFGVTPVQPDTVRVESLLKIRAAGMLDRVVISHDSTWCMRGEPYDPAFWNAFAGSHTPLHFSRAIVPMLKEQGMSDEEMDLLTRQNPLRYFGAGTPG